MIYLLLGLSLLILISLGFLIVPAYVEGFNNSSFLGSFLFVSLVSAVLYFGLTNFSPLINWIKHGQSHYQLVTKFDNLGGVAGSIQKIRIHLQAHPFDAKGWLILSKLYAANNEEKASEEALVQSQLIMKRQLTEKK